MDAAQALFLEKDFATTSVDQIVRAADVAKGTFYVYFKTKEDVLEALQNRFVEGFCERLEDAAQTCVPNDWTGRLDAWVEAGVNCYLDELDLHDLVFHQFCPSDRHMKQNNPVVTHLTELIEDGAKNDAWVAERPGLMAVMLFNALHGAVDEAIASSVRVNRKDLFEAVTSFYRQALGVPSS
ncbi:MAG: TetR/AcrR family transcriptional regulator [Rhodospirillales bacterium]|nr:TetR/AcrR family transcriptional regulator [Rhodospirillales bacterium]